MRKLNKKGIEMTISFIVMLILAIAVLAGSLILIDKFFRSAQETKESIDSQTSSQIRSMLVGGAKVAIPVNRIETNRGELITFGVGILNVLTSGTDSDDFEIYADPCEADIAGTTYSIDPKNIHQDANVKKNDQKIFLVGYDIERNTPRGTYICNIYVTQGGSDYAEAKYKAYIVVD